VQTHASGHEAGPLCPVMLRMSDDDITGNIKKEMKFKGNNNENAQNETKKYIYKYIIVKVLFTCTIHVHSNAHKVIAGFFF
jgi:hypothetical protein